MVPLRSAVASFAEQHSQRLRPMQKCSADSACTEPEYTASDDSSQPANTDDPPAAATDAPASSSTPRRDDSTDAQRTMTPAQRDQSASSAASRTHGINDVVALLIAMYVTLHRFST